jgi:hypothetical protein
MLVAISPSELRRPVVTDIAYANLRLRRDRIKNIRRLINIAGLLQRLADLVRPADAEFDVLERFFHHLFQILHKSETIAGITVLLRSRVVPLSKPT